MNIMKFTSNTMHNFMVLSAMIAAGLAFVDVFELYAVNDVYFKILALTTYLFLVLKSVFQRLYEKARKQRSGVRYEL